MPAKVGASTVLKPKLSEVYDCFFGQSGHNYQALTSKKSAVDIRPFNHQKDMISVRAVSLKLVHR